MSKLIRLSPTGIEYGDYTWNFASGCGNNIDGKCKSGGFKCWAYSISQRFKNHYPNGFKPTIYPEALLSPLYLKKPSRILCAFMGDLFWGCSEFDPVRKIHSTMPSRKASITMSLNGWIFTTIKQCPQHTFLFLTKKPQNLNEFSPFPDNCWVGGTVTNWDMLPDTLYNLKQLGNTTTFISFEPLLEFIPIDGLNLVKHLINWVIIGSQTQPYKPPKIEWVREIIEACDKAGIPVFLKNNLRDLLVPEALMDDIFWESDKAKLRQEYPIG